MRLTKLGMRTRLMFVADIDYCRHLVALVMDSDRENPLFHSPIGENPKHILDLGTGQGNWAMYVNKKKP